MNVTTAQQVQAALRSAVRQQLVFIRLAEQPKDDFDKAMSEHNAHALSGWIVGYRRWLREHEEAGA